MLLLCGAQYDMEISKLVPSSSASIEELFVGNISPIKTSRNNARVKYGLSIVFYRGQSVHTRRSDVYKTWMTCPSYFIVHSSPTCDTPMYTKLKWLVHRILSFRVRAHTTLWHKHWLPTSVGICSGSPQLSSAYHGIFLIFLLHYSTKSHNNVRIFDEVALVKCLLSSYLVL